MEFQLNHIDDIYLPDNALYRSFVGIHGLLDTEWDSDEDVRDVVETYVNIRTDDSEISDVSVSNEDSQIIKWKGVMSFPHTPSWDVNKVKEHAKEMIKQGSDGDIEQVEYGYSRPAHEYLTENWAKMDVDDRYNSGGIIEQWIHTELLIIVGLIQFNGPEGAYSIARLAPPVPSPYSLATYWTYSQCGVAQSDMKRYMLSIDGAYEDDVEDPVKSATDLYPFVGNRQEWDVPEEIELEEMEDVDRTVMESLPSRPLTREEVGTVVESYTSVTDGDCTLLLPDEPKLVDETVRKTTNFTNGEYVSFTVVSPEQVVVFELEETNSNRGFQWVMKEGDLDFF